MTWLQLSLRRPPCATCLLGWNHQVHAPINGLEEAWARAGDERLKKRGKEPLVKREGAAHLLCLPRAVKEVRKEIKASFLWLCYLFGLDIQRERERGLRLTGRVEKKRVKKGVFFFGGDWFFCLVLKKEEKQFFFWLVFGG